jgi:hypothetical protein
VGVPDRGKKKGIGTSNESRLGHRPESEEPITEPGDATSRGLRPRSPVLLPDAFDELKECLGRVARHWAIVARVKKGFGQGEDAFRKQLAIVFDGSPSDSAMEDLIQLGREATLPQVLALARENRTQGAGADAIAEEILRSPAAGDLVAAIRESATGATSRLVQALPWRTSVNDAAVAALTSRIRNR